MSYLHHVDAELSEELQRKFDEAEIYSDLGLQFLELEPTRREQRQIEQLKRQVRQARLQHERETGELVEVEPPTPPNAYPEAA